MTGVYETAGIKCQVMNSQRQYENSFGFGYRLLSIFNLCLFLNIS